MAQFDLEKLKQIEVEIFKEFILICQKLNLKYYILGGTLLGAIRHKGFIPWDDDIDVGMLRADYDIFINEAPKYLDDDFFLQTHESDPNYIHGFAKIRKNNTAFIQRSFEDVKMNHGIFIDIFPLDIYAMEDHRKFKFCKFVLNERILLDVVPTRNRPLKGKLIRPYAKWRFPTMDAAFSARESLYLADKKGKYIANHNGAWEDKEIIPADWYAEGSLLEFEGIQVCAPKEYDKWLTQVYGNYMQLPPKEKQVSHHDAVVIDAENSYLKYVNW